MTTIQTTTETTAAPTLDEHTTDCAAAIHVLPLPTGKRHAVRLTDEQIGRTLVAAVGESGVGIDFALWAQHPDGFEFVALSRAIETAVLAANGEVLIVSERSVDLDGEASKRDARLKEETLASLTPEQRRVLGF
jgi:hypothetical protein